MINSNNESIFISESNYSYEFYDDSFIKKQNDKISQLYKLEDKEKDLFDKEDQMKTKILELILRDQRRFNYKYNQISIEKDLYHKEYNNWNDKIINYLNSYRDNNNSNIGDLDFNSLFANFDNQWIFPEKKVINQNEK